MAQCGSTSASRWADHGRRQRATGDGLRFTAEAQRAQRSERSSERRATSGRARIGPTSGVQRSTKWRVASCEWPPRPRVLHRPRTTGRRATRNFHKPQRGDGRRVLRRHRATGRRATCHLYNPRRGDGRRRDAGLPQPRNGEATGVDFTCTRLKRRRRCDGTANDGHSPRGDERRGTATGGERRAAIRNTASRAGVPNKPMMLAAPGCGGSHDPLTAAAYRQAVGQPRRTAGNELRRANFGPRAMSSKPRAATMTQGRN